jgi:hypothetical protein
MRAEVLMSILYVNNFDIGAYGFGHKPCSTTPTGQFELVGFRPALDLPTQFLLNNHPSPPIHWGEMQIGTSCPVPSKAKITVQPSAGQMVNGNWVFSNGAVVTLNDHGVGAGLAPTAQPVQSATAYLLPPISPLLAIGTLLRATLDFDMPMAVNGAAADVWAVALNFKDGSADDGANDSKVAVTCQFSGGGNIRFHGTDYPAMNTDPGVYAQFSTNPATEFSLCVQIALNGGGAISGDATLTYGTTAQLTTHFGHLKAVNFNGSSITAVGASIVTTSNGFDSLGARLRSFCLEIL